MLKIENTEVVGWEAVIRGMRNPLNSWQMSDSIFVEDGEYHDICGNSGPYNGTVSDTETFFEIGPKDYDLMTSLCNAGTDHRKFMRMITVYLDITAPLYWWKEFDTYKVGTVANSCSTMHKIADKEFTLENFSCEHLSEPAISILKNTVEALNQARDLYLGYGGFKHQWGDWEKKHYWWSILSLKVSTQ